MTEPQLRLQAQAAEAEGSPQIANSLFFSQGTTFKLF